MGDQNRRFFLRAGEEEEKPSQLRGRSRSLGIGCGPVKVLQHAAQFSEKYDDAALVTVVSTSGSTPRHVGTHMLVSGSGRTMGTIGGGRIEFEMVAAAQAIAAEGGAKLVTHNLVQDLAMCCGGSMRLYVEELAPQLPVIAAAVAHRLRREAVVMLTDLQQGGKRIVPRHAYVSEEVDGTAIFSQEIVPAPRVVLFGCGHLARALGPLARALEFEVILCDDNETAALDTDYAWADAVVTSFSMRDIEHQVGRLGVGDYLLVLTRDHGIDQRIMETTLPRVAEFEYLGLIGSLGKVGRFRKRILAKGLVTEEQWKQLHAPIGLDIGAETPQEIAVSILAELVRLKNGGAQ